MTQYQREMFKGAPGFIHHNARILRKNMTEPELLLWSHLRGKPWGYKFRHQHALAIYIVDFYCHQAKLVIEVDGKIHLDKKVAENDEQKDYDLKNMGLTILRFSNDEVTGNVDHVLATIKDFLMPKDAIDPLLLGRGRGRVVMFKDVNLLTCQRVNNPTGIYTRTHSTARR